MAARGLRVLRALPPLETALVVLAVIVLGLLGVAQQSAQAPLGPDSYSAYDYAGGGYRGWYEVLQREGVRVERFEREPAFLDSGLDTLVWAEPLPGDPQAVSTQPAGVRALDDWVKNGGALLYLGYDDDAATKGILKLPHTNERERAPERVALAGALAAAGVTRIAWSAAPRRYRAKAGAEVLARDRYGSLAVRYAYGRGRVTAIVDEGPARNVALTRADNARFAYFVARPRNDRGTVAFYEVVHGHVIPERWWEIVPRPFAVGVACAALALLVAFAGTAVRLGPPIVPPALREPTSLEFIDSVAGLLERGGGAGQAVTDAVRSTKRVVATALGLPDDAPSESIAARIASPALRADFSALAALERPLDPTEATLLRAATLAQRLRKEYAPHAGSRR